MIQGYTGLKDEAVTYVISTNISVAGRNNSKFSQWLDVGVITA